MKQRGQPLGKAPYYVGEVRSVLGDYHLDMSAPYFVMQPSRPNPTPFLGNVPELPTLPGTPVTTRGKIGAFFGIAPYGYAGGRSRTGNG